MLVLPHSLDRPARLLVMIHGVCTPVSYVCGAFKGVAADNGLLICPVGNTTCGSEGTGPPSWEEPFAAIDDDVEASIKALGGHAPGFSREGSVLMGFSRGGYAAVILAVRHPGRWPLLILNEADVELTLPMARAAGIRAVALIAGEWGNQLEGERKTADTLTADGVPARLWTMPKAGHFYSTDIDVIMKEALEFVLAHEHDR
jgi:pimeloyl-ACP methyl ester carboxylesterase